MHNERSKTNCHQCRRNNRGRVVYCSKCGTKQYGVRCIEKWYPTMVKASFAEACSVCLGICNCSVCQKSKVKKTAPPEAWVDVSFNQLGGLCTICFLEKIDGLIGKDHLFKQSIILIKAWCYYESRIPGAHWTAL